MEEYLEQFGFEPFLPIHKVLRQWSDRKKKVEVPLFNSYIFVHDYEHRIRDILQIPGISWNIRHNGKPAILRQEEKDMIERFVTSGLFMEAFSIDDIEPGDHVKVIDGPLRGAEGILSGDYSEEKFVVVLDGIDQAIKVSIDKKLLKKMD